MTNKLEHLRSFAQLARDLSKVRNRAIYDCASNELYLEDRSALSMLEMLIGLLHDMDREQLVQQLR